MNASVNFLSNGVGMEYGHAFRKNIDFEIGIYEKLNIKSLKNKLNPNNFFLYQGGYSKRWYENNALNLRMSKKVYTKKNFQLSCMLNVHITFQSLLSKDQYYLYFPATQTTQFIDDLIYTKPALGFELTVGPKFKYKFSKSYSIQSCIGFGGIYTDYSYESISTVTGDPYFDIPDNPNRKKGYIDFVGFSGLPMITIGILHNIKKIK